MTKTALGPVRDTKLKDPVGEIRNMVRIWPECKIESGIIMHILKLWEFKKGYATSIWEDRGNFSEGDNI